MHCATPTQRTPTCMCFNAQVGVNEPLNNCSTKFTEALRGKKHVNIRTENTVYHYHICIWQTNILVAYIIKKEVRNIEICE